MPMFDQLRSIATGVEELSIELTRLRIAARRAGAPTEAVDALARIERELCSAAQAVGYAGLYDDGCVAD